MRGDRGTDANSLPKVTLTAQRPGSDLNPQTMNRKSVGPPLVAPYCCVTDSNAVGSNGRNPTVLPVKFVVILQGWSCLLRHYCGDGTGYQQ